MKFYAIANCNWYYTMDKSFGNKRLILAFPSKKERESWVLSPCEAPFKDKKAATKRETENKSSGYEYGQCYYDAENCKIPYAGGGMFTKYHEPFKKQP